MFDIRVKSRLKLRDAVLEMYRDIRGPFVFPGMELTNLFNYEDGPGWTDAVETVEYDHISGHIFAHLKKSMFEDVPLTWIMTSGIYEGWTVEWYCPEGGKDVEGPILIGAASVATPGPAHLAAIDDHPPHPELPRA